MLLSLSGREVYSERLRRVSAVADKQSADGASFQASIVVACRSILERSGRFALDEYCHQPGGTGIMLCVMQLVQGQRGPVLAT